jgi:hypothetical protein
MNKKNIFIGVGFFLFFVAIFIVLKNSDTKVPEKVANAEVKTFNKKIKYRFEVSNPGNQLLLDTVLNIAIPPEQGRQKVTDLKISLPYQISIDEVGNRTALVEIKQLPPYQTMMVDVLVSLVVAEGALEEVSKIPDELIMPDKYVESDHPEIVKVATDFHSESDQKTARKAFDWVKGNLNYAGFVADDLGALYALKNKKGDCTEYMYLYGAILRANKIPTRLISGFIVDSNKLLESADYHNWVEVYLDGQWRVIDPQKEKFMENENAYVVMRILQNNGISRPVFKNSQQLVKLNGQAKVSML